MVGQGGRADLSGTAFGDRDRRVAGNRGRLLRRASAAAFDRRDAGADGRLARRAALDYRRRVGPEPAGEFSMVRSGPESRTVTNHWRGAPAVACLRLDVASPDGGTRRLRGGLEL